MQRKKITWNELAEGFEEGVGSPADRQWCLEEAIDIVKQRAGSGADDDLAQLLETLYEKLKELGADAWESNPRRDDGDL